MKNITITYNLMIIFSKFTLNINIYFCRVSIQINLEIKFILLRYVANNILFFFLVSAIIFHFNHKIDSAGVMKLF